MNGARAPLGRWLLAVAAAGTLLAPATLPAQETEEVLTQRRLEYRAARDAYEAARSAFSVVERQFSAALERVGRARRAGDEDALEQAFAVAQERSGPLRAQETRVEEARERLAEARRALIDVITVRLGELLAMMDQASSAAERAELDALWRDLANEQDQLEAAEGNALSLRPVVLPEITFDPRDGPDELEAKAQILDRLAAVADTVIEELDGEIQALEDRLRIERQRRDFLAGTDRFDDTRMPVVSTGGAPPEPAPAVDSAAVRRPLTLDERLEALRSYREQLVAYRTQLQVRARQFRERVRRMG
jgi:hypothetical protein